MRYLIAATLLFVHLGSAIAQDDRQTYLPAVTQLSNNVWNLYWQCNGNDCNEVKDDIYFTGRPYEIQKKDMEKGIKQKIRGRILCIEPNGNTFDKIPLICFTDTLMPKNTYSICALGENFCYRGSLTFDSDTSFTITGFDVVENKTKTQKFRRK